MMLCALFLLQVSFINEFLIDFIYAEDSGKVYQKNQHRGKGVVHNLKVVVEQLNGGLSQKRILAPGNLNRHKIQPGRCQAIDLKDDSWDSGKLCLRVIHIRALL